MIKTLKMEIKQELKRCKVGVGASATSESAAYYRGKVEALQDVLKMIEARIG